MWLYIVLIVGISVFGIVITNRSKRKKRQFNAQLHGLGIHQTGLPQVPEGKLADVLLGEDRLYVQCNGLTFELALEKVISVRYATRIGREIHHQQRGNFFILKYDMSGSIRTIVFHFSKAGLAKNFVWGIENKLYMQNSSGGVIEL